MPTEFLFAELNLDALAQGKPFDGLAPGTFRDMHGRTVTIAAEDLPTYVANTKAAIDATRGESGELAGLPIDSRNHEHRDAAGWLVDVEQEGGRLRVYPRWTEMGRELISKGLQRFFSATVDLDNKVILGGTLTNWPATRDPRGKVLLRPIELALGLFELGDVSLDEKAYQVRKAFYEQHQPEAEAPYVVDTYDDHVICRHGEKLYRITYEVKDGELVFAKQDKWTEVRPAYVEAMALFGSMLKAAVGRLTGTPNKPAAVTPPAPNEGVLEMELTPEQLQKMISDGVTAALAAQKPPTAPAAAPAALPAELASLFDLDGLSDAAKASRKAQLDALMLHARTQADFEYKNQLAQLQRENAIFELAQRVVGGTADAPRGLPGVTAEQLREQLLKLPAELAQFWIDLMDRTIKSGLVEFTELGHGKRMAGTVSLPAEIAERLDEGVFKIADLSDPILGLGDVSQYDTSRWQGK